MKSDFRHFIDYVSLEMFSVVGFLLAVFAGVSLHGENLQTSIYKSAVLLLLAIACCFAYSKRLKWYNNKYKKDE